MRISRRLRYGELSSTEEQQLVAYALKIQADPTMPWEQKLGEWIEDGRAKGLVTDQQWEHYVTQPGVIEFHVRERIHPGDPIVLQLDSDHTKIRASFDYGLGLSPSSFQGTAITIIPDDGTSNPAPVMTHPMQVRAYRPSHFVPLIDGKTPLSPGKYKAVVQTNVQWPDPQKKITSTVVNQPIKLTASFEVFPTDQPQLIPVNDPELAQDLQDAIVDELMRSGRTRFKQYGADTYLSLSLKSPSSPIAGSFEVTATFDRHLNGFYWAYEPNHLGNYWQEQTVYIPDQMIQNANDPSKPFNTFTLRLKPDPQRLKQQLTGYKYLDHTLWLKDIPMGLPEP